VQPGVDASIAALSHVGGAHQPPYATLRGDAGMAALELKQSGVDHEFCQLSFAFKEQQTKTT
jgi:hypothetical protein